MKAVRAFVFVIAAMAIISAIVGAFLMYRGVTLRATHPGENKNAVGQYEQLVSTLANRGDTNSAAEVANLVTMMQSGRAVTDLATTVRILENLRSGQTNEAIELLESRLDGAVMSFDEPAGTRRELNYDSALRMAKEYRSRYPHKEGVAEIDSVVERVFCSLPK